MEKIAISVIIPVYNVEKYLAECLDSVISQDIQDIEIICVNDGSTDGSGNILKMYMQKDNRIKVVNKENEGLSCARNVGIKYAKGDYLLFVDSDDCLSKHVLKKLYETAEEENVEILTFDAECFYETEELKKREYKDNYYHRKKEYSGIWTGDELFCELIENDDFCDAAWILFIKNSWIKEKKIRFMPGILHEDCLFSFQCYINVERITHRKWDCLRYRIREGSIMTSKPSYASLIGRVICYKEIMKYLMSHKLAARVKTAISKYAEFIMYNIKYTDFALEDAQKVETENLPVVDRLLMNSLGVGKVGYYAVNESIYELGFEYLVRNSEKILLYGAGKIGRIVWNYLKQNGMSEKVIGFAISEKNMKTKNIEGVKVKGIREYVGNDMVLVLITARGDYQDAMVANAREAGFGKIETIDFRLEQILMRRSL